MLRPAVCVLNPCKMRSNVERRAVADAYKKSTTECLPRLPKVLPSQGLTRGNRASHWPDIITDTAHGLSSSTGKDFSSGWGRGIEAGADAANVRTLCPRNAHYGWPIETQTRAAQPELVHRRSTVPVETLHDGQVEHTSKS